MAEFERNGIALFAISYDAVDLLADFSAKYGITYPLLSDAGSVVIRQLGLYNEHLAAQSAAFGMEAKPYQQGVPYPGLFVLDEAGTVVDKRFFQAYRERETASGLLERGFGVSAGVHGHESAAANDGVQVRVYLDSPTYRFYQRLWLNVELRVAAGLHIYGHPIPEGFIPLTVAVEPIEGLVVGEPEWPATHPFTVAGLNEAFHVYEGLVRVAVPLTFQMQSGPQTVRVRVRYQACSDSDCRMPEELAFELPVEMLPLER